MKKTCFLFLTVAIVLILAACGSVAGQGNTGSAPAPEGNAPASTVSERSPENRPENATPSEGGPVGESESSGKKILIAYFSATNNTENIANHLDDILDADLYEIVPEIPYTSDDLNYNGDCRANREQNDDTARPAISGSVDNMEQYDVIFLGYPIWWGQAPKIMYTFAEAYDLSGKTIVPFCTSGSSGIGSSATNLAAVTDGATWLSGNRFSGNASQSTVENWVDSLNLALASQNEILN